MHGSRGHKATLKLLRSTAGFDGFVVVGGFAVTDFPTEMHKMPEDIIPFL